MPSNMLWTMPQIQSAMIGEKSNINRRNFTGKTEKLKTEINSFVMAI